MGLKNQDISVMLRNENLGPNTIKVIQHLHAENVGLKQEISGICRGLDQLVDTMNKVLVVASMHNEVFKGMEQGRTFSETIESLRAEHLSGVVSEEVKQ